MGKNNNLIMKHDINAFVTEHKHIAERILITHIFYN